MVRCYEWNWSWLRKWRAKRLFSVIFPLQLWNGKWWVRPAALVLAQSPCHACASRLLAKLFLVVKFPFCFELTFMVTSKQIIQKGKLITKRIFFELQSILTQNRSSKKEIEQSPCHACASRLLAKLFLVVKFTFKGKLNQEWYFVTKIVLT